MPSAHVIWAVLLCDGGLMSATHRSHGEGASRRRFDVLPSTEWRIARDGVTVAIGGDGGQVTEPLPASVCIDGGSAKVARPPGAIGQSGPAELLGALLDELLTNVECGSHVAGHGSCDHRDQSGDQIRWSGSGLFGQRAHGSLGPVVQDRGDVIDVLQRSCVHESWQERADIEAVGFDGAQRGAERSEGVRGDDCLHLVLA